MFAGYFFTAVQGEVPLKSFITISRLFKGQYMILLLFVYAPLTNKSNQAGKQPAGDRTKQIF